MGLYNIVTIKGNAMLLHSRPNKFFPCELFD